MPKRQQSASSSFGRNESHNLDVQASGDQLESEEDDDMTNMFPVGVKLLPNLVTRIEENLLKTVGKLISTNFPSQQCNMVYFRTGLHVGIMPNE